MERYFITLSDNGTIEIPEPLLIKLCWHEGTTLYQFTRCGGLFVTDHEPNTVENSPYESQLDKMGKLNIPKELLGKAGIEIDESLAAYVFYDGILGLSKDFRECVICGKADELAPIKDKYICYDCTLQISGIEDNSFK